MMTATSSIGLREVPLLWVFVAFSTGAALAFFAIGPIAPIAITVVTVSFAARRPELISVVLLALVSVIGYVSLGITENRTQPNSLRALFERGVIYSNEPLELRGRMSNSPINIPGGRILEIRVEEVIAKRHMRTAFGNVRLYLRGSGEACRLDQLLAGNAVTVLARLKRENRYINPGTRSDLEALDRNGIVATGTLKSCLLVTRTSNSADLLSPVYRLREKLTERVSNVLGQESAGIVIASLLGNRYFLNSETGRRFRASGTFHVLIISGLHITLLGGLLLYLISLVTRNRLIHFLFSNAGLWLFVLATGAQIPVVRAGIMFSVYLLAYAFYLRSNPLNSLGCALLAVIVWRPADISNPSFQLTALSLLALVGFAFPIVERLKLIGGWSPTPTRPFPPIISRQLKVAAELLFWNENIWKKHIASQLWRGRIEKSRLSVALAGTVLQRITSGVFQMLFVSASIQLFLFPLFVWSFHRLSIGAPLANLFVGSFVLLIDVLGILALVLSLVSSELALGLAHSIELLTNLLGWLQATLASGPFGEKRVPTPNTGGSYLVFLYCSLLGLVVFVVAAWDPFKKRSENSRRLIRITLVLFGLVSSALILQPQSGRSIGELRVTFLDVGQGDAAFLEFPNGKTMLIDGGGQRDLDDDFDPDISGVGEKVVSEFLWERGFSSIDYIVSTHPDADHIQGLVDVVRNFEVSYVIVGGSYSDNHNYRTVLTLARKKGARILRVNRFESMAFGELQLEFLNPGTRPVSKDSNEQSIVIKIKYRDRSLLFTGDIEERAERRMIDFGFDLGVDVVKVAHHGSRTSSTAPFVSATRPRIAIISVGKRSPYGHPHQEVVDRWIDAGAEVMTTGANGAIEVVTDGKKLKVGAAW